MTFRTYTLEGLRSAKKCGAVSRTETDCVWTPFLKVKVKVNNLCLTVGSRYNSDNFLETGPVFIHCISAAEARHVTSN
jgi:hypothetical protein